MDKVNRTLNWRRLHQYKKQLLREMKQNPENQQIRYYYAKLLNDEEEHEQALEMLETINTTDYLGSCYEYVRACICMEKYDLALQKLDETFDFFRATDSAMAVYLEKAYILCLDKLEMLNDSYYSLFPNHQEYIRNLLDYSEAKVIRFLKNKREKNNELGFMTFDSSINLYKLYYEVRERIQTGQATAKKCASQFDDVYYFYCPGINDFHDRSIDLLMVTTIKDSDQITNMILGTSRVEGNFINEGNFKCLLQRKKKKEKVLTKKSQIEKFNKRYFSSQQEKY